MDAVRFHSKNASMNYSFAFDKCRKLFRFFSFQFEYFEEVFFLQKNQSQISEPKHHMYYSKWNGSISMMDPTYMQPWYRTIL